MTDKETKALIIRMIREGLHVLLTDKKVTIEQYQAAKDMADSLIEEIRKVK